MNVSEKNIIGKNGTRIQMLTDKIIRIRFSKSEEFTDTGLSIYGFLHELLDEKLKTTVKENSDTITVESTKVKLEWDRIVFDQSSEKVILHQSSVEFYQGKALVKFKVQKSEDWIGFGDQTRTRLYHRGTLADLNVRNVKSYIPVPFFMSTEGYGVLVNTTYRIIFDVAKSDSETLSWMDHRGEVDYFILLGNGFKENLNLYTSLCGKPKLPPEWAFGLWYICRNQANDYEAANDALNFRREKIPCDVIGLEPRWMDTYYDCSTAKKWNSSKFPVPDYCPNGSHNFINALKRMGFHFELWLCNEYDHSYEEERKRGSTILSQENTQAEFHPRAELDEHFAAPRFTDTITKKNEPWFQHLKKFVDQGVDFFKQDGAFQVCEHPDRIWGNGMLDTEMHNLYPLLYSRQMFEGFAEYTGRRPVIFTPAGWTGFQAWCGTWTGDTGGRLDTLGAMLNTSIIGHSWATNDMEVAEIEGIHFGYLQPWSQINSWNYFRMPWLQGDKLCAAHKFYSCLRARLIPYLYSWAHYATQTGFPLMAPLTLEFPKDTACKTNLHQYLLGRDLLVGIYKNIIYFPEGKWKDYWTGETVEGKIERTVLWPDDKGGTLHVREGAIIPFGPVMQYRKQKPLDIIELYIFPSERESVFNFYEDDGISFEYLSGKYATTHIHTHLTSSEVLIFVDRTEGEYKECLNLRSWSFVIALASKPSAIEINGDNLHLDEWHWDNIRNELILPPIKEESIKIKVQLL